MPYIDDIAKEQITLEGRVPQTAGELNYTITEIIDIYFQDHPNYQGINDIVGALEGAKLEFYRRIAVPYEDQKIRQNGDVYTSRYLLTEA